MRIGIIGAGRVGQALAVRLAVAGHEVMLSNSRGADTLADVVVSIDGNVVAGSVADAARFGEIVVVAIPTHAIFDLPREPFAGRTVIDANNYYPEAGTHVPELDADATTESGLLASLLPGAAVVKAFNTIAAGRLLNDSRPDLPTDDRLAIPIAGDDASAKQSVLELIDELGFTAVDAGTLAESRRQQPGSPIYLAFAESRRRETLLTAPRLRELIAAVERLASAR